MTNRRPATKKKATKKKATSRKSTPRKARAAAPAQEAETNLGGRPTLYKPEYDEMAENICLLLGATDAQLAEVFGVCEDTINEWKKVHETFAAALQRGKRIANAKVARRLYERAIGYEHPAEKIFQYEGAVVRAPYTEKYAPDTQAASLWLRNREPETWRDKVDHEHAGPRGGAIPIATMNQKLDDLPDDEAARLYAEFIRKPGG